MIHMIRVLGVFGVLMLWTGSLWAFPQYTTRENAIRLAEVIDKAHFKSHRVASVFVKNRTADEYYLQVILNDGSNHDWMMDNIYEWTITDQLVLIDNRTLVFPSDESTEFHVLDKNQFYSMVLNSEAFIKMYQAHDLLVGKSIKLEIRRFRLIQPDEDARFKTDPLGNRYRYVLELKNGTREILTYLDAYQMMTQGAFILKSDSEDVILKRAFQVKGLRVLPKQLEDELRNIWRFGVEVLFDQNIPLTEDLFPFQIIEENLRDPKTGERQDLFYIHILFPNTEKIQEIPTIRTLEYLQYVGLVTDIQHQKRVFLRAQINPEVFELPPYIEVTNHNSVVIHFFIITDQSVAKRKDFVDPDQLQEVLQPSKVPMSRGTPFDLHYLKAVGLIRSVQGHHNLHTKVTTYLIALEELKQSALKAANDEEVSQAFAQRDVLYEILPQLIIENVQGKLRKRGKDFSASELNAQLEAAEKISENREFLKEIESLKNLLR
ncbi:hypothetical protein WDW89_02955 [Deltaproteobacteria bacterium TL4]